MAESITPGDLQIDTSSRSAIHTRQLRQPGDYLKNNRARVSHHDAFTRLQQKPTKKEKGLSQLK